MLYLLAWLSPSPGAVLPEFWLLAGVLALIRLAGVVVLQNNSPRQIDRVLVRVTVQERTYWDEEISRTEYVQMDEHQRRHFDREFNARSFENDDERRRAYDQANAQWREAHKRTIYEHHERSGFVAHVDQVLGVSQIAHILPPGNYSYPFSFALAPTLPGCAQFHRETDAADPAWRERGRRNKVHGEVTFRLKACVDVAGVFARDLVCRYGLTVNPAFDWAAMRPAHGSRREYVIGFLLSVVLTAIPFALVMTNAVADSRITAGIVMLCAIVQIVVHMIYFLHMNTKSENGWTLMALIFTAILVVIVLSGSLWVMYHMNLNMMPQMSGEMSTM